MHVYINTHTNALSHFIMYVTNTQVPCICLCCILLVAGIIAAVVGIKMALP